MTQNQYILEYLLKNKKITKKIFEEMEEKSKELSFDPLDFLLQQGDIKKEDKLNALSSYFDLPWIDLDGVPIAENFEKHFNIEILKRYQFVPIYFSKNGTMIVATGDPQDPQMHSVLQMMHDGDVEYVYVEKQKIKDFLNSYEASISSKDALNRIVKTDENIEKTTETDDIYVQDAPAVRFVDSIIKEAISLRASDIHIEPCETKVVIRYRIDGELVKWEEFPISSYPEIAARIKIMSNIDIAEKRVPQDGHMSLNIGGEDINFRVSTLPIIYGEKFVIRVLDNKIFSYSLKELNFSKNSYELIKKILKHPHGIILLTGPTGSGKTTTLYAFLREINDGKNNIVTIEDPVEYAMDGVNQLQVNKKANLTFASSLRSILRQDPDVIMVGEIRDEETAQIATRAAITGHLVLSTLHTNDAPGAVIRLVDMGIPPYLANDALVAVISQRLVKKLCPHCKKKMLTDKDMMNALNIDTPKYIFKPQGCPYCGNTGYRGRVAVHEIMYLDEELKSHIDLKHFDTEALRKIAIKNGMISLKDACKNYVIDGITSFDEYLNILLGNE